MTDRELLKLVEEGMKVNAPDSPEYIVCAALRARLAQLEPEPFEYWNAVEGWVKIEEVRQHFDTAGCGTIYKTGGEGRVPLYTTPQREWVGLTDEEINTLHYELKCAAMGATSTLGMYRILEKALKEKNT